MINEIFIYCISFETFIELRTSITNTLPLNELIIYSLPEGLWVLSITLTSNFLFFKIGKREINLIFAPLIFSISLELFQLFHFTNGIFDYWDIIFAILFWAFANYLIKQKNSRQNIFNPFNIKSIICLLSYLIVYLSHV